MNKNTMINNFIHKFKKLNKLERIVYILITLLYFTSLIFFTRSVLKLSGIETFIRILILLFLYIFLFLYFFGGIICLFTKKIKSFVAVSFLAFLFSPIMIIGSYYIDKTYGIIDRSKKKYVTYKSCLVSLSETTEYKKIGMINIKDDPTGYIIPTEMIKKYKIEAEIVEYDDYVSMMSDLYEGNIDALFIADNYITMFQNYETFEKIATETKVVKELGKELKNVDNITSTKDLTEPFTILLMGVDATEEGIASSASFNGDTLMLVTFNPNTLSATIFSIPRDTYVPIACRNNEEDKINSSAYGGTTCVINTIQQLIGINIDYYLKINFSGVVNLVDDLGGIYVDVPISFCEQDSQRRFDEHLVCLEAGYQKIDGEGALALSRHRHSLPLGDFQRVQHQQLVLEAMVKEIKNIRDIDSFYKILEDVSKNIDTNMTVQQILSLYNVGKSILINKLGNDAQLSIQKTYLTGYDLTMYIPKYRSYIYTFQYYKQSLAEIVEAMKINLELVEPTLIKTFSFDANEVYEPLVAGKNYYQEDRRELLPSFVGSGKEIAESFASTRNINLTITEITSGNSLYDETKADGTIVAQSISQGTLVEEIKDLNISVIKKSDTKVEETKQAETPVEEKKEEEPKKEEEKDVEETIPDFVGKSISEYNKWRNNLKNVNIIAEAPIPLGVDQVLALSITDLKENVIYKQSPNAGTKLSETSKIIVYYYQKIEEEAEPKEEQAE